MRIDYKEMSPDVVRLRDKENMSFPHIVAWLATKKGISVARSTVCRAYDFGHADEVQEAAESGKTPKRGSLLNSRPQKIPADSQVDSSGQENKGNRCQGRLWRIHRPPRA